MTNGRQSLHIFLCPVVDAAGRRVDLVTRAPRPDATSRPPRAGAVKVKAQACLDRAEHGGKRTFVVSASFPVVSRSLRSVVSPAPCCRVVGVEGNASTGKGVAMDMSFLREGLGPLMSRKEAARYLTERGLRIAPQTLARKFTEGTGPLCTSLNRRAMYYQGHLELWFREQLAAPRRSSSAPREPARTTRPVISSSV